MADVRMLKKHTEVSDSGAAASPSDAGSGTVRRVRRILTTTRYEPPAEFGRYTILIYGQPKVGKTTLVSQFPGMYSFMFEPNDSYALYKDDILTWDDFLDLEAQFLEGKHKYTACAIDTAQAAYELALRWACKRFGFEHPGGQDDFGQSWDKVRQTFVAPMLRLMQSKYGFVAIAHQKDKENNKKSGGTSFTTIMPDMSSQAAALLVGKTYNIFYYYHERGERWLQIVGDEMVTAGNRMKGHFMTPSGERVYRIPMGDDEEEAYRNLMLAFDNKQKEAFKPESREALRERLKK